MGLPGWDCSVLLTYLFWALAGADSFLDSLPPPENLSLLWVPNTPCVSVHWRKPSGLGTNCQVNYTLAVYYEQKCPPRQNASKKIKKEELSFEDCNFKEDELCVSITTNPKNCDSKLASKEVYKDLSPPPALVKNFSCVYYARTKMNCTWTVENSRNISLFYREEEKNNGTLKPCRFYLSDGPMKTGCHLDDEVLKLEAKVYFVISGTAENHTISNNSFIIDLRSAVKPPKPRISIRQEDERLRFEISIPDYLPPHCWKYKYMYIKCSDVTEELKEEKSTSVDYDAACKYTVRGKVIYSQYCGGYQDVESDVSEPEYYGEDGDPNLAFKVAMIITPLIVCCCLIAAIVLFRRNKDIILPKIPEPSLFFKDMLNSTTDGLSKNLGGGKLYVPVKEVVASGVSLEPKSILLHPNHDTWKMNIQLYAFTLSNYTHFPVQLWQSRNATMVYGYRIVNLTCCFMCFSVMLAGVTTEPDLKPPKVYITQKGQRLCFQASTPNSQAAPQCWKYKFIYSKCNGKDEVIEMRNNSTYVDYDAACKYTVRGKVIYSQYCGGHQDVESDVSEPEYYGEDGDPNLAFKVAMIVIPLIVCCCLNAAIVLFRRNKDIILPKIPEPSLFFKDMLNSTTDGLSKNLGGGKLYVPVKEVVASGVSLEPKSILLHPNHDTCI
ncbi:uncharacterized protein LOC132885042 [Neoarius graeffei]|uniref:uncharacterized protein LOC132885042 n=1 Tax=Neoarius graeffei TaxID=443677 RepID=UPI00298D5CFC|nr:uncharacterized protein LOC132885042 [Neoarius graeffei]